MGICIKLSEAFKDRYRVPELHSQHAARLSCSENCKQIPQAIRSTKNMDICQAALQAHGGASQERGLMCHRRQGHSDKATEPTETQQTAPGASDVGPGVGRFGHLALLATPWSGPSSRSIFLFGRAIFTLYHFILKISN